MDLRPSESKYQWAVSSSVCRETFNADMKAKSLKLTPLIRIVSSVASLVTPEPSYLDEQQLQHRDSLRLL